jgi:hypothetical protein
MNNDIRKILIDEILDLIRSSGFNLTLNLPIRKEYRLGEFIIHVLDFEHTDTVCIDMHTDVPIEQDKNWLSIQITDDIITIEEPSILQYYPRDKIVKVENAMMKWLMNCHFPIANDSSREEVK